MKNKILFILVLIVGSFAFFQCEEKIEVSDPTIDATLTSSYLELVVVTSGEADKVFVEFGDGNISEDSQIGDSVKNTYAIPGTYTVKVSAHNYGYAGNDTEVKKVTKEFEVTIDNNANSLVSMTIEGLSVDISGTTGSLTIPAMIDGEIIDVTSLVPTFTLSAGASATIGGTAVVSGETAIDFSSAQTMVVTANTGDNKSYTLNVTVTGISSAKDFVSYSIGEAEGVITGTNIMVKLPYKSSFDSLIPTFTVSEFAWVTVMDSIVTTDTTIVYDSLQTSGVTAFDSMVIYRVHAQDSSIKEYTVSTDWQNTVELSLEGLNPVVKGMMSGNEITLNVLANTDTMQVVTFTTYPVGATVYAGSTEITSGVSEVNFASPVDISVVAAGDSVVYKTMFSTYPN